MTRTIAAIFAFLFLANAVGAEEKPIQYRVVKFYDSSEYLGWSVVELEIRNKGSFVGEVLFFCQLKNAKGYTWAGKSSVLNLKPGEQRKIRVPNEGDTENFNQPTHARCVARLPSKGRNRLVD